MSVTVAKTAGFCFGVRRAVDLAEQQAKKNGKIYAYGEIIHNMHEIERLEKLGVYTAYALEDIPDGAGVLIRAHGVPRNVYTLLQAKKCEIFDATCPFVRKIHKIADKESADGRLIVILGSAGHPEVVGIQGWCGESVVLEGEEQARAFSERPEMENNPISLVAQTTVNRSIWNISVGLIKKRCTNLKIFDTICKATDERQSEARLLAGASDQMIGDKKSCNTKRLYEISRSLCSDVRYIEDAAELTTQELGQHQHIGITAGASTPAWIIKEVSNMMSEETKIETGEDFAAMLEESFKTLNNGEKVTGTVVGISNNDVQVDLGVKHTAYIPLGELSDDPNYDVAANIHVGDEIEAVVVRVNDGEGTITLSKKRVDQLKGWETVEKAYEEHTVVEGVIVEENRGGVVATAHGVRVFIPASQTGVPKDQPMSQLVKTKQSFYITEINRQRKRVVGSIREIQREARKAAAEQIWNTIEIGNEYDGTVKSLTSYGAFVDIGGVDGMVHISELSWGHIRTPGEVVKPGDQIEVFVLKFDPEKKKISLGYKTPEMNPWNQFLAKYSVGDVVTVKIVKLVDFGAFAEIMPGVDGLIHISQISDHRVEKASDALQEGQEVEAKIIDVDTDRKRISLSIRALLVPQNDED